MAWNISFPYNNAFIAVIRNNKHMDMSKLHLASLQWLDCLQQGRDYEWGAMRDRAKTCIVNEYLYFDKEEDLLAFRLAVGI
jgi:hypothetical protein